MGEEWEVAVRPGREYFWCHLILDLIYVLTRSQIAEVPMKMRDRLKPQYQNALRGKYSSLTGGELHTAVTDLVMGYRKNYDMVFPPLNTPPILLRYLRELALPCKSATEGTEK